MPRSRNGETSSAHDRRRELVQIAYRHIAERGFEGLRVRDVAQEAGINNATLHYYFPTKEALIQSVVEHLMQEFQTNRAPRAIETEAAPTPLDALRLEFEDLRYRFLNMPDMFIVLTELAVRSRRDPVIAQIMKEVDAYWHAYLLGLLQRGVHEGVFRQGLDLDAAAAAIMAQLKAVGYQATAAMDAAQVDRLIAQIASQTEFWLTGRLAVLSDA